MFSLHHNWEIIFPEVLKYLLEGEYFTVWFKKKKKKIIFFWVTANCCKFSLNQLVLEDGIRV